MKKLLYVLTGLCLLAGIFTGCEKESEKAKSTIKGVVTDKETGSPLSGVIMTLQPTGTCVQTAQDGTYSFENLKAGTYTLKAQKEGYDEYTKEAIWLIADQTLPLDIEMEEEYKAESDYTVTMYGLNLEMVYVEGGEFEMEATAEQRENAAGNEWPVRTIKLDGYHIGKYEVTQAQWKAVMGTAPSYFKGDNLPVEQVSWNEAVQFCEKLSQMTGKTYRLPTEAEWEYAARGGQHADGTKYAGSNTIDDVAWYNDNSVFTTHPVGQKQPNGLGLYDMSGNVWEWCSDWYGDYDANDTDNPQGSANGSHRVLRGGGWLSYAVYCRVSYRGSGSPDFRYDNLGFRVACSSN